MEGAGAAVAVVGVEVGAFVRWRGCETHFFVAAGGLEFVVAAHRDNLRLLALDSDVDLAVEVM